jgi:ABC-type Fe3+/spermidine/putrescine transport system ATPase subunit
VGAPVMLAIRPEKLRQAADADHLANRVSVRVTEVVYLGDQLRALIDFGNKQIAMVKMPASLPIPPKVGDAMTVGWAPADANLFATA